MAITRVALVIGATAGGATGRDTWASQFVLESWRRGQTYRSLGSYVESVSDCVEIYIMCKALCGGL